MRRTIIAVARDAEQPRNVLALDGTQRTMLVLVIATFVTAAAAPYPLTKAILGVTLALYWAKLFFSFDERFVGMMCSPSDTPVATSGSARSTWSELADGLSDHLRRRCRSCRSTAFPARSIRFDHVFSIILILSAVHGWLTLQKPVWPILMVVKNWLFPFSLFFLGRRCFRNSQQLWFVLSASWSSALRWRFTACETGLRPAVCSPTDPRGY